MCIRAIVNITKSEKRIFNAIEANRKSKDAAKLREENSAMLKRKIGTTRQKLEELGLAELSILRDLNIFSDTIGRIQNRPRFGPYSKNGLKLPEFNYQELKNTALYAGSLLVNNGKAAIGTAEGFAVVDSLAKIFELYPESGAVYTMSCISHTEAIASVLRKDALTPKDEPTMKEKSIVFGKKLKDGAIIAADFASSAADGILGPFMPVSGIINIATGAAGKNTVSSMSKKAEQESRDAEKDMINICEACGYLDSLSAEASRYLGMLGRVKPLYDYYFGYIDQMVNREGKYNWKSFGKNERIATQTTVMLAELLNKMCHVNLVDFTGENEMNRVNSKAVDAAVKASETVMRELGA